MYGVMLHDSPQKWIFNSIFLGTLLYGGFALARFSYRHSFQWLYLTDQGIRQSGGGNNVNIPWSEVVALDDRGSLSSVLRIKGRDGTAIIVYRSINSGGAVIDYIRQYLPPAMYTNLFRTMKPYDSVPSASDDMGVG